MIAMRTHSLEDRVMNWAVGQLGSIVGERAATWKTLSQCENDDCVC